LDAAGLSNNEWGRFLALTGLIMVALDTEDYDEAANQLRELGQIVKDSGGLQEETTYKFWSTLLQSKRGKNKLRTLTALKEVYLTFNRKFKHKTRYEQFLTLRALQQLIRTDGEKLPQRQTAPILKIIEKRRKEPAFGWMLAEPERGSWD